MSNLQITNSLLPAPTIKSIRISPKGQVTLPKSLRDRYGLAEGQEAIAVPTEEGILIKRKVRSLRGLIPDDVDLEEVEKALAELRAQWSFDNPDLPKKFEGI